MARYMFKKPELFFFLTLNAVIKIKHMKVTLTLACSADDWHYVAIISIILCAASSP